MVSLSVDDQGTPTAAEPTRILVFADEYSGMLLPIAVFDPDRLAFLEFMDGLAHRVRLAAERSTPENLQPCVQPCVQLPTSNRTEGTSPHPSHAYSGSDDPASPSS